MKVRKVTVCRSRVERGRDEELRARREERGDEGKKETSPPGFQSESGLRPSFPPNQKSKSSRSLHFLELAS